MTNIIALCGEPGAGKSEVRRILVEKHGFVAVRVADTLKRMVRAFGLTDDHIEGDLKNVQSGRLCGITPRRLMQVLGYELPQALGEPNFWPLDWEYRAAREVYTYRTQRIVVEDHRYPNERPAFMLIGDTQVWRVIRPTEADAGAMQHPAENQKLHVDQEVYNNGTLADLERNVDYRMTFSA